MSIDVNELAALLGVVVAALTIGKVLVTVGEAKRMVADLERRHGELAKELRERMGAAEHRTNGLERWQGAVDAKLSNIHDTLVEVRTMISRREGA